MIRFLVCFEHSERWCLLCADKLARASRRPIAQTHDQTPNNLAHPHDAAGSLGGGFIDHHVSEQ